MEKINLLVKGQNLEVSVIRYFHQNNNQYLIYSLDEVDPQGYVKLYIAKIETDVIGNVSAVSITDENEWTNVKEMIKNIIRTNKEGNLVIDDLDYTKLNDLEIPDYRVFKLSSQLVEILGANKKIFSLSETSFEPTTISDNTIPTNEEVPAEEPVTPSFEATPVEESVTPSFDQNPEVVSNDYSNFNSFINETNQDNVGTTDYQLLYEEEKNKNIELTNKINELQTKIDNIKNILNN